MAEDDIYKSKFRYDCFKANLETFSEKASNRKYYCKNPSNLVYFKKLFLHFEARDLSYVRRLTVIKSLKIVVFNTEKNLKDLNREDVDRVVAYANRVMNPSIAAKFKQDLRCIWRIILPEHDEKGRPDETRIPYVVRHLKTIVEKSKQKARKDRLSWEEFQKILDYFSGRACLQFYLMFAFESLGRPQELLWRKIKDVELHDNYAKIYLSTHGKEGIGILQCIDSYSYLTAWLNVHPFRKDQDAFLFLNDNKGQLTPVVINKHLRIACKKLGIKKPVTCYSLKRNGVTFRKLRGDSDLEIQRVARWTSTDQLKTYDLTDQEDALKLTLMKRGMIPLEKGYEYLQPKTKPCIFCNALNKFSAVTCRNCNRPLDRQKISELEHAKEIKLLHDFMKLPEVKELFETVLELKMRQKGVTNGKRNRSNRDRKRPGQ